MSRPTGDDKRERAFEAEDINPEIVAAIDEIQSRRQLEIDAQSAQAEQANARVRRRIIVGVVAALCVFAIYYALA
ncbi:MAG: hypothetical protein ACKVP4_04480 [Hyphomicrobium sp.]